MHHHCEAEVGGGRHHELGKEQREDEPHHLGQRCRRCWRSRKVHRPSLFRLYGTPMTGGGYWTGLYTLVAICLVGLGAGVVVMERRDVGS